MPLEETLSQSWACADCGTSLAEITPRLFSFNSPYGACTTCTGLGTLNRIDAQKVVVDPERSIDAGAVGPWQPNGRSIRMAMVKTLARAMGFSLSAPWSQLPQQVRDVLLWGSGERELEFKLSGPRSSYSWRGVFEGVITSLERKYKETDSEMVRAEIERYMSTTTCPACDGKRLRPEALAVKVGGLDLYQVSSMPVAELRRRVAAIEGGLTPRERRIAEKILKEVLDRVGFLEDVGVGYLSLERASATLSGGESQRIRLATQIGSKLMGVLYVLDEPSIGLHQRDNAKLIATLKGMRDLGNSVLVVEHDEETILAADWVVDLGPGAGVHGGAVVAEGPPEAIARHPESLTGKYLRGDLQVPVPARRQPQKDRWLTVEGARHNNLRDLTIGFPLGLIHGRHRRLGVGEEQPRRGRAPQGAGALPPPRRRRAGRARQDLGDASPRQGDRHRPEPHRPHAAQQSGHLHQSVRPHPLADGEDAGGAHARLRARPLQLQRQGRPLRGLRRRRADQDRDALPARPLRALRGLRRQALRPRDPGGALQGPQHRADPRAHRRAGPRAVPERAGDREDPRDVG